MTFLLFGSLVGVASAATSPLEEGLNAVRSSVEELPKLAPPPAPELPVVSPPRAPAGLPEKEKGGSEPPPRPEPRPAAPSEGSAPAPPEPIARSVDRVVADVEATAGSVTTVPRGGAPAPEVVGARSDPAPPSVAGISSDSGATKPSDPRARSIRPAVAAPLRELLAYVWPAVALGPIGRALATRLVELERALSLQSAAARPPVLPSSNGPVPSDVPRPSPTSTAQPADPDAAPLFSPHGGGMSLLVTLITVMASLVGLVALARLTVGEDFFSTRWLR